MKNRQPDVTQFHARSVEQAGKVRVSAAFAGPAKSGVTKLSMTKSGMTALTLLAASMALTMAVTPSANAALDSFGPIDVPSPPGHGYPLWYTAPDAMSLVLCLDEDAVNAAAPANKLCLLDREELAFPANPVSFPDNFWGESFYTRVDSEMPTANGTALLVTALEAAFFGDGVTDDPKAGDNIVFARIRLRIDNPVAGATLKVTHPFGVNTFMNVPTGGTRNVNFTNDFGRVPPINFDVVLGGVIGPFLRWTAPDFPVLDQNGNAYIGDPAIPHEMTGSPLGTNFFRVEGPIGLGTPGASNLCADATLGDSMTNTTDCIETVLFVGSGKIARDTDSDGTFDLVDNCPTTANPGQEDSDNDGIGDACDNCIDAANGSLIPDAGGNSQLDTDGDGFGNMCDADLNNDNDVTLSDFSAFRSTFGTMDADADFNGDGDVSLSDFSIFRSSFGNPPGPSCCGMIVLP